MKIKIYFLFLTIIITSCKKNLHQESQKIHKQQVESLMDTLSITNKLNGIDSEFIGAVSFNLRKPNFIILHHTALGSITNTIKIFTSPKCEVSIHYVIAEDGKIIQMLNDYFRAWHAGNGSWGKSTDMNSNSIGIELDNDGRETFTGMQIKSLLSLLTKLKEKYTIPTQNIIAHSDISPGRKNDPSALFPWKTLAENGFGVFIDSIPKVAPKDFNAEMGLKIIGYNTKHIGNAVKAFKLHYIQTEVDTILNRKTINAIYNIYLKQ